MKKPKKINFRELSSPKSSEFLESQKPVRKEVRKSLKVPFISNIPLPWIEKALKLQGRGAAVKLALMIWYKKGLMQTKEDLVISRIQAQEEFGVHPRTFSRVLKDLEVAGMIEISEQKQGRSPRVTVIWEDEG